MELNKQQKKRRNQTIINDATTPMYVVAGMLFLMLALAGMIATAWAADDFDARSTDARIAADPNSTHIWDDPFVLNISDRVPDEYGREKLLRSSRDDDSNSMGRIHPDDPDPIRDFRHACDRMDMPPDEYQRMAESGSAGHLFDMPPEEYRRVYEEAHFSEPMGGTDYGDTGYDERHDMRTERASVVTRPHLTDDHSYKSTATEEFSGEVVQLTCAQTTDIVWDKDNFGGFCYDMGGGVGTETLSIAAGTLTGPDTDRTIDAGALSYTTSPIWREYELHRNLGLTVDGYYYGGDSGYWIEFWMGEMYVAINGNATKLAKPLVEFNSTDTKTLIAGEGWDLGGGFTLVLNQIDLEGNKVWLSLSKNGMELDNEVINASDPDLQDRVYTYTDDVAGEDDIPIFSCYVSEVIRGTDSNIARVKYVFLIDNEVLQISTGEYYGNMYVTSVTPTQVTLGNWKNLYLSQYSSTCQITGNLSFKTVYNTGAIEFHPHLIRNELPVLSGGGGFASSGCGWYSWNLSENYTIGWYQVDLGGVKALIVLCKDGVVVDEMILTEEWRAPVDSDCRYSYVRDGTEIITITLKMVFRGCDANMIELGEVYQRSEVDGSILINNESHLFPTATEPSGTPWNLSDGYMLTVPDVSLQGDKVRLQLSKDGVVVKEKILSEDYANTFIYTSGIGGVSCVVDRVFHGCEANAVKLVDVDQYSEVSGTPLIVDGSYFCKSGDPEGMPWELSDGYVLTMKDLNYCSRWWYHVDDKVWLELSKDGVVLKEDILESGGLFDYRNGLESFDCVVEVVFHGCIVNVVKLKNINQYSSTGAQLIDNESKTYASANPTGERWERWEGYSLDPKDIDFYGNRVWLSLSKDGAVAKDEIIDCGEDRWFKYYNATGALIFSTYVDGVFRGTYADIVQLMYTTQYSEIDGSLLVNPSDKSWQLWEGYNLTAIEIYYNGSVWLQLSKNSKVIDEDRFYNGLSLQNDIVGHTIVSGTISSYNAYQDVQLVSITQYSEATGAVLATWESKTLNETGDCIRLCPGLRIINNVLKGDLNGDSILTPADAAIALRIAASGGWDANADVSDDGSVTSLDALMILQAAAGAIDL